MRSVSLRAASCLHACSAVSSAVTFAGMRDPGRSDAIALAVHPFVVGSGCMDTRRTDAACIEDPAANGERDRVAFVGQFIRHATLTRDVRRFGAARYHAFVASSLQHEEERTGDVVSTPLRCVSSSNRRLSDALLEPYNASAYYQLTKHLGLRAFFDRDVFLYPHRIASFFSTVSRAARGRVALDAV